jgi:hypothetical protein
MVVHGSVHRVDDLFRHDVMVLEVRLPVIHFHFPWVVRVTHETDNIPMVSIGNSSQYIPLRFYTPLPFLF